MIKVIQIVSERLPELKLILVSAIISMMSYVNTRDILMFLLEQLILKSENEIQETVIASASKDEIKVIIQALIHFVVKYPEISDQSMNILKLIAKVNDTEIDMQQLCLKECLNIIKMKIYETHTIIYILNSFAA